MARDEAREELRQLRREAKRYAAVLLGFVVLTTTIELVDLLVLGGSLDAFGVRPRTVEGLLGVPLHPFLHVGLGHVLANAAGFLILGGMTMLREERHFWVVFLLGTVVGGLGIWVAGAGGSVHVGASGVVFAFFGYLLFAGWFERRFGSILLSLFVLFGWGGMIFGVLPGQVGVSWEGHLFGFVAGALAARLLARRKARNASSG